MIVDLIDGKPCIIVTRLIIHKQDRIDYIMNGLEDYFKMPKKELGRYYRGRTHDIKRIAVKLLVDIAECSYADIGRIWGNSCTAISRIYTSITEELESTYGRKELKKLYEDTKKALYL